jgi:hypothetical protein
MSGLEGVFDEQFEQVSLGNLRSYNPTNSCYRCSGSAITLIQRRTEWVSAATCPNQ